MVYNTVLPVARKAHGVPASRQLGAIPTLAIWAALCLAAGIFGAMHGFGGHSFGVALAVFAALTGFALIFAARGVAAGVSRRFGPASGVLLAALLFLLGIAYLLGTGTLALPRVAAFAGIVFVSAALAVSAGKAAAGAWQDYVLLAALVLTVKYLPAAWLWPYPDGRAAHIFVVLFALGVALVCFVLIRGIGDTGYSIGWGPRWSLYILGSFALCAVVLVPLGEYLHFLQFAPQTSGLPKLPLTAAGIFLLTAWPEEFVFRGLLQNFLSKSCKSDAAGWWSASMIFGFAHISSHSFPNWRYAILAAVAGLFYGWTWRKTGSIFASALVHTLVDALWHVLFRTV